MTLLEVTRVAEDPVMSTSPPALAGDAPRALPLPGPADVVLADGRLGVIRRLTPADGPALHALHDEASDDALRMRFFNVSRAAAHAYVDHVLTHPDTIALVAETDGRLAGLATAEPVGPDTAEIAMLISDGHQGQGLGTLLLEHLFALVRDQGMRHVEAEVLVENHPMLEVLANAGFELEKHPDRGVVLVNLHTTSTPEVQEAADRREFQSEARSLAPLLAPQSVAIAGARGDGSGVGAAVLRSVAANRYAGRVVAVHPRRKQVAGLPAYPSFSALPEPVDLAVIAVPAETTASALEDAAAAGVRAAVVISSGFGEMGARGRTLQRELSVIARTRGIRLVGPNCLGVLANDPAIRLNATFNAQQPPPPGGLAIASQSGGVGIVLLDLAREIGLGVRSFVSLGNTADVSSNDLLAAWYDDPGVTAAALYLESFGNARKFARFARRFSERKPVLAVVGGRSTSGRRGGVSHTAAAASSDVAVRALFAQSGVIGCDDADDLAETALLLTEQPLPAGPRLGVLSNAGGMGILVADAAESFGLTVPEFTGSLRGRLADLVHGTSGTTNPVDAGAAVTPDQLGAALEAVLSSGEVDAVVAVVVATGVTDGGALVRRLAEVRSGHPGTPVVLVPLGGLDVGSPAGLTSFRSTTSAVRALGRAVAYARWRSVPPSAPPPTDTAQALEARKWCRAVLADAPADGRWLAASQARHLLDRYGLHLLGKVTTSADAAVEEAARIGFPVAVKVANAGGAHKSERRLVRTGLASTTAVRLAVAAFEDSLDRADPLEILVQPMVSGREVALGVVRDPTMGPLVMVAAGGVTTDVLDDRVFLLPPVSLADARRALRGLRMWPLLEGFRGARAVDVGELERLVVDLGRMAVDVPEIAELDLNPVMVDTYHCCLVDARLRLATTDDPGPGAPRQLRRVE
jgi:acyl-CoA synthetase (NDP forming)/RimJ/RimL family protein N-acetyltransferase